MPARAVQPARLSEPGDVTTSVESGPAQVERAGGASLGTGATTFDEAVLPPPDLVFEACQNFFQCYTQLGFLHRPSFLHQLQTQPDSISPFLVLCIIVISSRITPALADRYTSPALAAGAFAKLAHSRVLNELSRPPSLELVQALLLLSLHDAGTLFEYRAKALQGLARQMAETLRLHEPVPSLSVIENEVRRRTWWFLTFSIIPLDAQPSPTPAYFQPGLVPVPLPSNEQDFTFGVRAHDERLFPNLARLPRSPTPTEDLSLLGAYVTARSVFGEISRAVAPLEIDSASLPPCWIPSSPLPALQSALDAFTALLSPIQHWTTPNLLAYRASNLDLGFWSIHATLRAAQILLYRAYLPIMARVLSEEGGDVGLGGELPPGGKEYWRALAGKTVENAFGLLDEAVECLGAGSARKGMTPHLAFCVYIAGTVLTFLRLHPNLAPSHVPHAPSRIAIALSTMHQSASIWPVAEQWHRSLYQHALSGPVDAHIVPGASFRLYAPNELVQQQEDQVEHETEANGASAQHAASTLAAMARRRSSASGSASASGAQESRPTSSSGTTASHDRDLKPVIAATATYVPSSSTACPTSTVPVPSFSGLYTPPQPEHRLSFGVTSTPLGAENEGEDEEAEKAKVREARRLEALLAGAQG
ncbi:zn(2)-C6 fungal-type transcription factor [Rhodotorula toruloides]|uniref:Zn(2)-C6 fungal-type transcription factor n=1 Tax=Rhodotorula toruloides TaxID=5286 RepID=A0A511K9L9_RHOTO|nr:zn(2)-C6 fungal-type transcription factor [Rhodotorula toruloides]